MSESTTGRIGWIDLTVPDAKSVRDFYKSVANWTASSIEMDGYDDFCMHPTPDAEPVAGICHARGSNSDLPAQWLIYITVEDIEKSILACSQNGGKVIRPVTSMGDSKIAVIEDPAGAVCALYQK